MKRTLLPLCLAITGCNDHEQYAALIDPSLINHAPVIEALPPIKAVAGKTTKIKVVASDKDGDNLTYSIVNSPDWMSIENDVISITPSSEHAGKYTFKVKVSDGALTTQVDAPLVVNLPMTAIDPSLINHAPVIEALPPIKAVAGKTTKIKVVASDKDGDNLTYSIVNSPDWISIENNVISITPSSEHAGKYTFKVKVSDGALTTQVDAPLVVNLPMTAIDPSLINHAPVIEALPPIKAVAGKTTKIKVVASDKDGDNLTYSIVNSPDWMSIENDVISITPSSEHAGKYTFKVKVSDGALTTQVDAPLVVNLPMTAIDPSLINHAPVIEALPPIKAVAGKTTKIKVVASDKDGDNLTYSIVNSPDWMSIENDVISITPSSEHA